MPDGLHKRTLHQQFIRFAAVGTVGFLVNAGMVEALTLAVGPLRAQGISFPVAATVTWWLNRRHTFGPSDRRMSREWLHYVIGNSVGWAVNNGVYLWMVLHYIAAYRRPSIAVAAGSVAGLLFNFAISRWLIFNKRPPRLT